MRLGSLLEQLPEQTLAELCRQLGGQGSSDAECGSTLPEECARLLLSEEVTSRQAAGLKPWVTEVLRTLLRSFATLPVEQDMLAREALSVGLSGAQVKAALLVLRKKGILFNIRKSWGEEYTILPEEALPVWQRLLFPPSLQKELEGPHIREEGLREGHSGYAVSDVLSVLHLADRGELPLTKHGNLAKAALKKLEKALIVQDHWVEEAGLMAEKPHQYGAAVLSALYLAAESGLLTVTGGGFRPDKTRLDYWLQLSTEGQQRRLYQCWLRAVRSSEPWELHALAALEQAKPGGWYMVAQLFEWMQVCGMMNETAEAAHSFVLMRLLPMQAFGWAELRRLPEGLAFRFSYPAGDYERKEAAAAYKKLVVQQDLELILPPYSPAELLWEIMCWGESVSLGELSVYRLTRSSIRSAIQRGYPMDMLVRSLAEGSRAPLDQGVLRTVAEWATRHKAIIHSGVVVLRMDGDPELCCTFEARESFRRLVLEKAAPGLYLVPEAVKEELIAELDRLDASYLLQVGSPRDGEKQSSESADLPRFARYRVQDPIGTLVAGPLGVDGSPSAQSLWKEIPSAWLKGTASYHPSTEKELVRTAIERGLSLAVIMKDSRLAQVVPVSLEDETECWSVTAMLGRERIQLSRDYWSGIGLVIPDY